MRGVPAVFVASISHTPVTLMWMNPDLLSFRYIPGYQYPERSPVHSADRKPATWVSKMVAAFNGGFHLADNVGGYYYGGRLVKPMKSNLGAFTINGRAQIQVGVWSPGTTIPTGTQVVRQNLPLLIRAGKSQAKPSDGVSTWGIVTYRRPQANRSALGQLNDGSLVFAVAHETTAAVLGSALTHVGVRTAVMLDMNGSWPTGFVYDHRAHMGRPIGHKITPTIVRPPSTYYTQFKKDFVVAEMTSLRSAP